jgi:preprotein translocase subunit SecG
LAAILKTEKEKTTMYGVVLALHILVSLILILVVLFQQPAKGGMGTVFGGGETIFGGGGAAPFMTRLTTGVAILFVVTSLTLVLLSVRRAPAPGRTRAAPTAPAPGPEAPIQPEQGGGPQGAPGGIPEEGTGGQ